MATPPIVPVDAITLDSNIAGLNIAEEIAPKTLAGSPVWYAQNPNSYGDFGGKYSSVARETINPSRQRSKGTLTDLDSSMSATIDATQTQLQRLYQGFFAANMREKATTIPMNAAQINLTSITATLIQAAAGFNAAGFIAGQLVKLVDPSTLANNGLFLLSGVSDTSLTTSGLTANAAPTTAAHLEAVGFQFATADAVLTLQNNILSLTTTTKDLTTLGLIPGEWLWMGGDTTVTQWTASNGYARIAAITAHAIKFDNTLFVPAADAGTGKTVQIFFGKVLKNEVTPNLILKKSYMIERTLGVADGSFTQAEYIEGAYANELTLTVGTANKVTADLAYVGLDVDYRDSTVGPKSSDVGATLKPVLDEPPFNTSQALYASRLSLNTPTASEQAGLYGYATDIKLTINNNVSTNKAIGVLGGISTTLGLFDVSGTMTVYLTTIDAVKAIRQNQSCGLSLAMNQDNAGQIWDMPLVTLGGGLNKVEKDKPITVDLTNTAAKNANQYTLLANFFQYLPNLATPEIV
jgi:Phage tail tube protein